jgi:hypothetical protein
MFQGTGTVMVVIGYGRYREEKALAMEACLKVQCHEMVNEIRP